MSSEASIPNKSPFLSSSTNEADCLDLMWGSMVEDDMVGADGQCTYFRTPMDFTVDSEILGSRVCGGSKIAKKKKIRKMLDFVAVASRRFSAGQALLMGSLLFTAGLLELKSRRKQVEKHLEVLCSFRLRSACSTAHLDRGHWHSPIISSSSELRERCKVIWVEGWIGLE